MRAKDIIDFPEKEFCEKGVECDSCVMEHQTLELCKALPVNEDKLRGLGYIRKDKVDKFLKYILDTNEKLSYEDKGHFCFSKRKLQSIADKAKEMVK